jgi:nanoRNase/pAp phosphatase (c-di-AMP/oligoRNAs hydrolase)
VFAEAGAFEERTERLATDDLVAESETLTVVCHNNPDPDCLASALALGRIAVQAGIEEHDIFHNGEISHRQNRAFVNLLDIDLSTFDAGAVRERDPDDVLAFVDHSTPGENNEVPTAVAVDVVIDHHPADDVQAQNVDHRIEVGATATILTEHVRELDVDETLATRSRRRWTTSRRSRAVTPLSCSGS